MGHGNKKISKKWWEWHWWVTWTVQTAMDDFGEAILLSVGVSLAKQEITRSPPTPNHSPTSSITGKANHFVHWRGAVGEKNMRNEAGVKEYLRCLFPLWNWPMKPFRWDGEKKYWWQHYCLTQSEYSQSWRPRGPAALVKDVNRDLRGADPRARTSRRKRRERFSKI